MELGKGSEKERVDQELGKGSEKETRETKCRVEGREGPAGRSIKGERECQAPL